MNQTKNNPAVSIRLPEDDKAHLDEIGLRLHQAGVFGMTESNGTINRSAVIRYLIRQEVERVGTSLTLGVVAQELADLKAQMEELQKKQAEHLSRAK